MPILPKTLSRVLQAIKEYNFSYSVITPQHNLIQGNMTANNMYSRKTGCAALRKLCVFDQVKFGRASDKIQDFLMCTFPRNFKVAVYYRRCL